MLTELDCNIIWFIVEFLRFDRRCHSRFSQVNRLLRRLYSAANIYKLWPFMPATIESIGCLPTSDHSIVMGSTR